MCLYISCISGLNRKAIHRFSEMFGVVLVQYSIFKDPSKLCSSVEIIAVYTIRAVVTTIRPVTPRSPGYL
jgi:hypothetical protein